MAIDHNKLRYTPTLRLQVHEMRALEQLFDTEKDRILPTVLIQPWGNSLDIEKGFARIDKALNGRSFCVDLDPLYRFNKGKPSAIAQMRLFTDSADEWYDFVRDFEHVIPYLRPENGFPNLDSTRFRWLRERGFGLSIRHPFYDIEDYLELIATLDDSNFFVNVDAGWDADILSRQNSVNTIVRRVVEANQRAKIVVTSSTFPYDFSGIGVDDPYSLDEIDLFESAAQIAAQTSNEAEIFYGDWATTRPPSESVITNFWPRLDIPLPREIRMFREKCESGESPEDVYEDLAEEVVASRYWPEIPESWGKYIIDLTAAGSHGGIRRPNMNVSPRINMHIHTQIARLGVPTGTGIEEYED